MAKESHIKIVHAGKLGYSLRRHLRERFIEIFLFLSAVLSVAIMLAIITMLVKESFVFFQHVSIWDFLTDTQWTPLFDDAHYGILPLISGTVSPQPWLTYGFPPSLQPYRRALLRSRGCGFVL